MASDKNVRIRADLVPLLEARSRRMGVSLNAYVSDVLRVHLHPGEWARGMIPPGLTSLAEALVESVGSKGVWLVLWGGPVLEQSIVAGRVVGAGPTHVRLEIYGSDRMVVVPRMDLRSWWLVEHQDHPEPEIRDTVRATQANPIYVAHLL